MGKIGTSVGEVDLGASEPGGNGQTVEYDWSSG